MIGTTRSSSKVRKVERARNLCRDARGALRGDGALAGEFVGKAAAAEVREHEVNNFARLVVVDRRADERMHEPARGLGLAPKADAHLLIAREVRMHHLHGERPPEPFMLGSVHVGHSAAPNAAQNAIAIPRRLPERGDQRVGNLGGRAHVGERRCAFRTLTRRPAIPGTALGTKHSGAPAHR